MLKEKLTSLIQVGKVQEALDRLILLTRTRAEQIYNDLILLSGRLSGLNGQLRMGLIDQDDYRIESSKIYKAVLDFVDQIAELEMFRDRSVEEIEAELADNDAAGRKTKILFVATNPKETHKLQLEKEYLAIREIFRRKRGQFEITEVFNCTLDQLFQEVQIEQPNILHIAGISTENHLILHRPDDTLRSVSYEVLASAFILFQPFVDCVFINSWCSRIFLKKVSVPLKFAVGSESVVQDHTSILFSSGFYTALSQRKSYEEAYQFGMDTVDRSLRNQETCEEKNPFVYYRNGSSADEHDDTPEDFTPQEPKEIVKLFCLDGKKAAD